MYQEEKARPPSVTGFPVPYSGPNAAANYNSNADHPPPPPPAPAPYSASTVSYQQTPPPPRTLEGWTTGLCDCFDDPGNCCMTLCCPCVTFGRIAEIVDKGSSSCGACGALYTAICCLTGCGFLLSCFYRSKMRHQLNLRGSDCGDCFVHCCCEYCALCQDYRELQNRGFPMDMGWYGNEQRTGGGIAMNAPPAAGHAMRR